MFLIVYANRMALGVPAELVNGPFVPGGAVPVQMADGHRHDGTIEDGDAAGTFIVRISGERWRLERRPTPSRAAPTPGTHTPTEYWMIAGPA